MMTFDLKETLRISGYGLLTWLIPFLLAIPFYSPEGILLIDQSLFKSIMVVTGSIVGAILIIRLFHDIESRYVHYGILSGLIWLVINWVLDVIILIPMSGLDLQSYFNQIGLRYLMIPVMTIMAGFIAQAAGAHGNDT